MLSVRLSQETEYELQQLALSKHTTKSDIVKEAVAQYLQSEKVSINSYEAGKDFFGNNGSNGNKVTDRSTTYKKRIKEKLNEKYSS